MRIILSNKFSAVSLVEEKPCEINNMFKNEIVAFRNILEEMIAETDGRMFDFIVI